MRITKIEDRWFDVPNDPDKARLKVKNLSPGERGDIFDKVFTQEVNYKKGDKGFEPSFSQNTDKKLDRELTLTSSIVDWENFFESDGKTPMVCNKDNIIRASREIDGFNELVTDLREQLAKDIEDEKEAQRKNLLSSASAPVK